MFPEPGAMLNGGGELNQLRAVAATAVAAVIVSRSSDGSKASADALLLCGTRETRRYVHLLPWLTLH